MIYLSSPTLESVFVRHSRTRRSYEAASTQRQHNHTVQTRHSHREMSLSFVNVTLIIGVRAGTLRHQKVSSSSAYSADTTSMIDCNTHNFNPTQTTPQTPQRGYLRGWFTVDFLSALPVDLILDIMVTVARNYRLSMFWCQVLTRAYGLHPTNEVLAPFSFDPMQLIWDGSLGIGSRHSTRLFRVIVTTSLSFF